MPGVLKAFRDPWVVAQFAWFGLVLWGAPRLDTAIAARGPVATATGEGVVALVGVVGAVVGVVLLVRGVSDLGRNLTPRTRPRRDAALVTGGVYALVRHPIYTGVVLLLAAYAARGRQWLTPALVCGISLLFFTLKARAEERHLLARFPEYACYRRRVGMLLPRLGRGA